MSPVGAIFVPFPPETGKEMLHPRPPPPIVEWVRLIIAFGYGKMFFRLFFSLCDWRVTSATDVSDQGGCSCVQGISVTLGKRKR